MRRILFISAALASVLVPAAALAAHGSTGDGTRAVRGASGDTLFQPVVWLGIDGAVVGHIVTVRLVILTSTSVPDPVVTGSEHAYDRTDCSTVYSGTDV